MRPDRPMVLFVDDDGWSSFDQTAIALRRQGFRVTRLITGQPAGFSQMLAEPHLRWAADRLFYNEVMSLSDPGAPDRVVSLLQSGEVVDVIPTEPTLDTIGLDSPIGRALTARSLSFSGTPPRELLDKFTVNERLAQAGLEIPRQAWASELSPSEAVDRFGLPLVLKRPMGASGDQVRIVASASGVEEALAELGHPDAPVFYQEHVDGKVVVYGAVAGPAGLPFAHGFRIEKAQHARGPAATASLYDSPKLLDAGRRALDVLRPQGFASFGFIETADGRLLHIDANIRPWGMITIGLPYGIDFARAYARIFGRSRAPAPALPVFPHAIFSAAREGRAADLWTACAGLAGYLPGLGLRYCTQTLARALLLTGRRLRDREVARAAARATNGDILQQLAADGLAGVTEAPELGAASGGLT